ncbi:MAG: L-threonylcarbamoyladenylate synthase [Candidatus ainarchaeum sp.]|nr:L-threonylcarbamoyladenylate synthase [Candidatus ainarchaeum sp.]
MAPTIKITDDDYEAGVDVAKAILGSKALIVYPTDTVYGIGGDATSDEVVKKVRTIKGIDEKKPLSVMMADFSMIEYYCDTGVWEDIIVKKYLPGPYTFVLKLRRTLPVTSNDKIGVRIPDSPFCQALCQAFGRPIITTSANPTGQKAPAELQGVDKKVLDAVGLAIDGGPTRYGTASAVVDLVERKMVREGSKETIDLLELPEP